MRRLAVAVALVVAAAAPAAAGAQTMRSPIDTLTFRGVTGQGHPVLIAYGTGGTVDSVAVIWRPRCARGTRIRLKLAGFGPAGEREIRRVLDARDRYRAPERGGRIGLIRIRMRGRVRGSDADVARQVWSGTLRATVDVRRHGVRSDRCTLSTTWRARPEGIGTGRWEQSEGASAPARSFESSSVPIVVKGSRDMVWVAARPELGRRDAFFTAPALNDLRAGVRYAIDEDVPGAAQFSVLGEDDGCSGGSFFVHALEFDSLGRLVHVRVTWEQPCPDGRPPWTGTIEWRATA